MPKADVYEARVFRGPKLSALVDRARPHAAATTVTAIGKDGYFATFDLVDLRKHAIVMAFEQDGKPMPPSIGGPISVRFDPRPLTPEVQRRLQNAGVLYVTHLIVGDEPAHLRIGARVLDDAELDKLPETSRSGPVSYRTGWEPTPQLLWGVRLRDVLGTPPATTRVLGKDALHQEKALTPTFKAADLTRCEPILVRRYGRDRARVPTRMGGPLLLAVNDACREDLGRSAWLAFVESVELGP